MAKQAATPRSSSEQSYLSRLQFSPEFWSNPFARYLTNLRLVFLLILTLVALGLFSYRALPRRLNPEVEIPIVTVVTALPGATPEDVESLVTIPLETELRSLKGVETLASSSRNSVSVITVQFLSSIDREVAEDDTQSAVDSVNDLPDDATEPSVAALDFEDIPIWTFALTSVEHDLPSLMRFSESLQEDLEQNTKVDRVVVRGLEEQEIVVEVEAEKLTEYGLQPFQLAQAVQVATKALPAGEVLAGQSRFSLTINPSITSVEDVRNLRVTVAGQTMRLGELATIEEKSAPDQFPTFFATPESVPSRATVFSVYKTTGTSIQDAFASVEPLVTDRVSTEQGRYELKSVENTADEVDKQFLDLVGEFRSTIVLVFLCLLLFLGLRQAVIASLTIPLTFLSAFIFMNAVGMSINFLSLFAFLLALGLLVDDSIVVVSAMTTYYKTGKFTPQETGLLVWRDTIIPIWSTTLTTIWSFVPLLLSTGIIGEFIKPIPVVVSATMISSTGIAVLITLPLMMFLLKPELARRVKVAIKIGVILLLAGVVVSAFMTSYLLIPLLIVSVLFVAITWTARVWLMTYLHRMVQQRPALQKVFSWLSRISSDGIVPTHSLERAYYRAIKRVLATRQSRRKVIIAIVLYSTVSFLLLPLGLVRNEFFPKVDADQLFINVELPAGSQVAITEEAIRSILDQVRSTSDVQFVTATIGATQSEQGPGDSGSHLASLTVRLIESGEREVTSNEVAEQLREKLRGRSEKISVIELSGGPPAGSDVVVQLYGEDLQVLEQYADQVVTELQQTPGILNIEKSVKPGTSALVFIPDQDRFAQLGISTQQVAGYLRTYASGFELDELVTDGKRESKKIQFRIGSGTPKLEVLQSIQVPTSQGSYPLLSLGSLIPQTNPVLISREDGRRTITVSASVAAGYSVNDANVAIQDFVGKLDFTNGYGWKTGGVNEENQESVNSILLAMGVAFLLILVTMVVQFQSYRQAVLVLLVIPLAVSSVFLMFSLTGTPLSFPALIGVLSLFGIVVTNSMFIVDKINLNRREGLPFTESIADAGASRLEPIILTKLCTVLGLL
ncbi:efflux RND transporter permease subunit, partial [Candidatus Woesebacteria bacterium]|nr:efflux RND transporter permease subunit [Candidatus Woesebacteria bacterium]